MPSLDQPRTGTASPDRIDQDRTLPIRRTSQAPGRREATESSRGRHHEHDPVRPEVFTRARTSRAGRVLRPVRDSARKGWPFGQSG